MTAHFRLLSQRRPVTPIVLVAAALLAGTPPASAQTAPPSTAAVVFPGPACTGEPGGGVAATLTFKAFGSIGYTALSRARPSTRCSAPRGASSSAGRDDHACSGLFGQVTIEHFTGDGERVFVFGGDVFPLGIRCRSR